MLSLTESEEQTLNALGERLRRRRLAACEPQLRAAARIGVSLPTYRKLEQGDPTAQIGAWVRALRLYGNLSDLWLLLPESLFERDLQRQRAPRQR
ncbi:MAG: hypothetical protein C1943_00325 [Halochromatium sp.]|nr:hypothetical protein [Halochromatium sp.]